MNRRSVPGSCFAGTDREEADDVNTLFFRKYYFPLNTIVVSIEVQAELDVDVGTLKLLEPAVV